MLRNLLLLSLLCSAGNLIGQVNFFKRYGGDEYDYGYDIVETADSGFLVTGTSGSFHVGHSDAFLMKLSKLGNREWSVPIGGQENDGAYKMKYIENVGIYLIGSSNSWSGGDYDTYVAFVDESGSLIWEHSYPQGNWERGVEAALTQDSGLVIGYNRFGDSTNNQDFGLMRIDQQGTLIWDTNFELPGYDEVTNIESFQDSLFVMSSNRYNPLTEDSIAHLTMFHEDGTVLWEDTLGVGPGSYTFNDFFISNDTLFGTGGVRVEDTLIMNHVHFRYRIDASNNYSISEWINNGIYESEADVITNRVGSNRRYIGYHTTSIWTYENGYDFHLARFAYDLTWESFIGESWHPGFDILNSAITTMDGGAAFIGYTGGDGGAVVALVRIGANDTYPQINGVNFVDQLVGLTDLTEDYGVKVYPNPANDLLTITSDKVEINAVKLFMPSGQLVKATELYKKELDISDLPTGVYLLQLESQDEIIGTIRIVKS